MTPRRTRSPETRLARAFKARSQWHAEQVSQFERELLSAPCSRHSSLAVCDQCVTARSRDSTGFPSVTLANGRGRYRLCPPCGKLFDVAGWAFAPAPAPGQPGQALGSCKGCSGQPG